VDGNRFIDLTSAFGVAGLGHSHAPLADAMRKQSEQLIHAMGDVHPTELKVEVCKLLSEITFERWGKGIGKSVLSNSGSEAVETALKTAFIATGKPGVICFENGYHGLGYGALLGSGFEKFRQPFEPQLAEVRLEVSFPSSVEMLDSVREHLASVDADQFGALLVEPIQGRGGKIVPPLGFLAILREWCDANEVILIFDEIYTGFNRTGKLFACEWEGIYPDLMCLGKALSGGYPISACVGKSEVMDKWPVSPGEALHTSTFLGNPVGCAMAVEALNIHKDESLAADAHKQGEEFMVMLREISSPLIHEVRGRGLMIGIELRYQDGSPAGDVAGQILSKMLAKGIIMLADGKDGNVLAFTPPFNLKLGEMVFVVDCLRKILAAV
jgi:4-aminobutyrate aminotransferase-like enzyme